VVDHHVVGLGTDPVAADKYHRTALVPMPDEFTREVTLGLLRGDQVESVVGGIEISWMPSEDADRGWIVVRSADASIGFKFELAVEALTDQEISEFGDTDRGRSMPLPSSWQMIDRTSETWQLWNARVTSVKIKRR